MAKNQKTTTLPSKNKTEIESELIEFVIEKFRNNTDRAGKPYTEHLFRVAESANEMLVGSYTVGLLHDLLEDTSGTPEELFLLGVSNKEIDAVKQLTKLEGCNYDSYISSLIKYAKRMRDPTVLVVKLADLNDNLNLSRLDHLSDADLIRVRKYFRARDRIVSAIHGNASKWTHQPCF